MKKPKQSVGWDDDPKDGDPMVQYGLEDDEEILDLEDIIDLEDEALEDDDHLGLDAEILDADEDFDIGDLGMSQKKDDLSEDLEEDLEDDFLKDLSFSEDEIPVGAPQAADLRGLEGGLSLKEAEQEKDAAPMGAEAALGAAAVAVAASVAGGARPDAGGEALAARTAPELDRILDEVLASMETRLMDAIRAMVEARLPDIVREILREEIKKAKELD